MVAGEVGLLAFEPLEFLLAGLEEVLEVFEVAGRQVGVLAEHLLVQVGDGRLGVLGQFLAGLRGGVELVLDGLKLLGEPFGLALDLGEVGGGLLGVGPLLHLGREVLQRVERPVLEGLLDPLHLLDHLRAGAS